MQTTFTLNRRLRAALAILAAGTALATPAFARWAETDDWANGQLVDVQLRVDGRTAPLYDSPRGDLRHYFEAIAGGHYEVVLRNNSARRVGVLISVDGLNVVNGERSRFTSTEPMYVLGPYETTSIQGWRTSLDAVRRFVFVDEQRSYAERTGQANADMGWIRVMAFREQRPWWELQPRGGQMRWKDDMGRVDGDRPMPRSQGELAPPVAAKEAPAAPETARDAAPKASSELRAARPEATQGQGFSGNTNSYPGTGWGDRRDDHVQEVRFTAERVAVDTHLFRYEYAAGLARLGIDVDRGWNRDRLGDRDRGQLGFAKPPRW